MITNRILNTTAAAIALLGAAAQASADPTRGASGELGAQGLSGVPIAPTGVALQLGGGVTGFSREETRDLFSTGGYWDVRAVFGTRSFVGAELAYVGTGRGIDAAGITGDAAAISNGAEATARANLPIDVGALRLAPFVFAGLGYSRFQIVNEDDNSSSVKDAADALTVPVGGGLGVGWRRFTLDARFTYRPVFDDDLVALRGGTRDHADLQNWSAGLLVGYEL